jgi:hypothetical protein
MTAPDRQIPFDCVSKTAEPMGDWLCSMIPVTRRPATSARSM